MDVNLNVPSSDVVFGVARLWGKFAGSGSYDIPFGTLQNFRIETAHTLRELMDPDFLTAIAVGTERSEFTVTAQWAKIRARALYACMGGTAPAVNGGNTDVSIGASNIGPVGFAAQILSNAQPQAPIVGIIYSMLCTQLTLDFPLRNFVMPSLTARAFVDATTNLVLKVTLPGDQTTDAGTAPAAPVLTPTSPSAGVNLLSWPAVSGATQYNVFRGLASGGPFVYIGTTSGHAFYDNSAVTGTTYYYVATSKNQAGESAYSAVVSQLTT